MEPVQLNHIQAQGFDALRLDNSLIALTIVPVLGGKISSLRDLRSGREWLWANPALPYRRVEHGASYVREADTGGWDECFPTVAACAYPADPWRGRPLPDHGELWVQEWPITVEHDASGAVVLQAEAQGVALPYIFRRRLRVAPGSATVRLDYRVQNLADDQLRFIWSAHPLLAIEPGMRLRLPDSARLRTYARMPPALELGAADLRWPIRPRLDGRELSFDPLPGATTGAAFKLWSEPLAEGWAVLAAHDGELRLAWDADELTQIGIWLNAGAWAGAGDAPYYNLGLEPCIGAQDSLEEAVTGYGCYAALPPHGERQWWVEVDLNV